MHVAVSWRVTMLEIVYVFLKLFLPAEMGQLMSRRQFYILKMDFSSSTPASTLRLKPITFFLISKHDLQWLIQHLVIPFVQLIDFMQCLKVQPLQFTHFLMLFPKDIQSILQQRSQLWVIQPSTIGFIWQISLLTVVIRIFWDVNWLVFQSIFNTRGNLLARKIVGIQKVIFHFVQLFLFSEVGRYWLAMLLGLNELLMNGLVLGVLLGK